MLIYILTKYEKNWRKLRLPKVNFYTQKKKNHLPAVILKFLTMTPNLTWNFETRNSIPSHPSIRKLGPSGLGCRSALDPEGTLKVLTGKLSVLRVSAHEFVFFQFFCKKASQGAVKIKSELLDKKSLTSPTCW